MYYTLIPVLYFIQSIYYNVKDAVADTLEQLWISYNSIEKLKGIAVLKKLKVDAHTCGSFHFQFLIWYGSC